VKSEPLDETQVLMNSRVQPSLVSLIHQKQTARGTRLDVGTGALLYSDGHYYIISCYHVVQEFMTASHTAIVIPVNEKLKLDKSHIDAWKGQPDPLDVACMKLRDGVGISPLICVIDQDLDASPVDWLLMEHCCTVFPGKPTHR
jgi:hypothetical protein